ncbi:MAG: hypothetical protein QXF42_03955 [Sulfolobales archaeon]
MNEYLRLPNFLRSNFKSLKTGVISFLVLTECSTGGLNILNEIATEVLPNPVGALITNTLDLLNNSSPTLSTSF